MSRVEITTVIAFTGMLCLSIFFMFQAKESDDKLADMSKELKKALDFVEACSPKVNQRVQVDYLQSGYVCSRYEEKGRRMVFVNRKAVAEARELMSSPIGRKE